MTSVLLVEDHEVFALALQRVLRERGRLEVVSVVRSAEEALEVIPTLELDLVLVDVSLPHASGIELVMALQQRFPRLPCVMLSGHLSHYYARRALTAGARGYIVKDRLDDILDGIRQVLEGRIFISESIGRV